MLSHEVIFANGAIGTMLMSSGIAPSRIPDTCRDNPQILSDLYKSYIAAGCTLLTTNTISCGDRPDAPDLCRRAMEIVREAAAAATAGHRILIAASIGPTASPRAARRQALAMSGADFILVETAVSLLGCTATVNAIRDARPDSHVIVSATVSDPRHLPDGTDLRQWAETMTGFGVERIGLNCGTHSPTLAKALAYILNYGPTYFAPSAGTPDSPESVRDWAATVTASCSAIPRAGVPLIAGGCCNTTPAHMAALIAGLSRTGYTSPHVAK